MINRRNSDAIYLGRDGLVHYTSAPFTWCPSLTKQPGYMVKYVITCILCVTTTRGRRG